MSQQPRVVILEACDCRLGESCDTCRAWAAKAVAAIDAEHGTNNAAALAALAIFQSALRKSGL